MAGQRRQLAQTILQAALADAKSDWIELTGFDNYVWTVRLSVTVADLAGTLSIRGTNNFPQDAVEPVLITPTLMSALPTGITYSAGVITFATPAIGTHKVNLAFPNFPQFIQADYDNTAGTGTVDLRVRTSGW